MGTKRGKRVICRCGTQMYTLYTEMKIRGKRALRKTKYYYCSNCDKIFAPYFIIKEKKIQEHAQEHPRFHTKNAQELL
jgi:hypothetical protein